MLVILFDNAVVKFAECVREDIFMVCQVRVSLQ